MLSLLWKKKPLGGVGSIRWDNYEGEWSERYGIICHCWWDPIPKNPLNTFFNLSGLLARPVLIPPIAASSPTCFSFTMIPTSILYLLFPLSLSYSISSLCWNHWILMLVHSFFHPSKQSIALENESCRWICRNGIRAKWYYVLACSYSCFTFVEKKIIKSIYIRVLCSLYWLYQKGEIILINLSCLYIAFAACANPKTEAFCGNFVLHLAIS